MVCCTIGIDVIRDIINENIKDRNIYMNFLEVKKERDMYSGWGRDLPKDIYEFSVCEIFAKYLSKIKNDQFDDIRKDDSLESFGIDAILKSKSGEEILIQVTHAKDHNMDPNVINANLDIYGLSIVEAAERKCKEYCKRELDTREIILLIDGIIIDSLISDLLQDRHFLQGFQQLKCFKEIYYTYHRHGGRVYPLKVLV